jgi:hypothetical protein
MKLQPARSSQLARGRKAQEEITPKTLSRAAAILDFGNELVKMKVFAMSVAHDMSG